MAANKQIIYDNFLKKLKNSLGDEVEYSFQLPLTEFSTYQTGGTADLTVFPQTPEQCAIILQLAQEFGLPFTVIGGGSNILISDKGIRGLTIILNKLKQIKVQGTKVLVDAGVSSHKAARFAWSRGLSGLEFLTSLPGSVGGAVYMNARAFGGEISQVLKKAVVVDHQGKLKTRLCESADFSYKLSPFKLNKEIVLQSEFALKQLDSHLIREEMDRIKGIRLAKEERKYPSCGCVFKNRRDLGLPAGKLIDEAGLKGLKTKNAWVYEAHANFIVHNGKATSSELKELMNLVRSRVQETKNIQLEFEVEFIGDWN